MMPDKAGYRRASSRFVFWLVGFVWWNRRTEPTLDKKPARISPPRGRGIIMERFNLDAVEAFELLTRLSQQSNTKSSTSRDR
ncbi:hypothetical protein MPRS_50950 [Mycobacterium paraseoulense]|nr:hypothetical protein MPRS_50950 [Mycobacterium paraseoulense]